MDNQGLKLVAEWKEANSKTQGTFNKEFSGHKIVEGPSFSRGTIESDDNKNNNIDRTTTK